MKKIMIYFTSKKRPPDYNDRIRKRFNIDKHMTINGMSEINLKKEDWDDLKLTEELGYIEIRTYKDHD